MSAQTGAELIAAERQRQIDQEGYTPEHDDQHAGDLALAAKCYLVAAWSHPTSIAGREPPRSWPWEDAAWKLTDDPVRNLVKAGALIAAEIDRLLRQETGE